VSPPHLAEEGVFKECLVLYLLSFLLDLNGYLQYSSHKGALLLQLLLE
jgi:hypothetical protein